MRNQCALALMLVMSCSAAAAESDATVPASHAVASQSITTASGTLRVLSLNLAHGRDESLNQMLLSAADIKKNLTAISVLLRKTDADIVALQEADGPSRWSGGFDHVQLLAEQATYPWYTRGSHATSWLFDYGTALMSRTEFKEVINKSFKPTPPSMTKGLTLGRIAWHAEPGQEPVSVDVLSVHLDFSRKKNRKQQIAEIAELLADRNHPLIVMGDFNSDWLGTDSVVAELARRCGMQVYQPLAENMATYLDSNRRLDWLLISDDLEFHSHAVLPEIVSDHQAIVADIRLKPYAAAEKKRLQRATRCVP